MKQFAASFLKDESGATAIEYGLLCCLIAVALAGAMSALAPKIAGLYESAAEAIPQD
jgi:pilus assembly protein Flp/PilA